MDALFISPVGVHARGNHVLQTKLAISRLDVSRGAVPSTTRRVVVVASVAGEKDDDNTTNNNNTTNKDESSSAWAAWQASRNKPEEEAESSAPRDPEAETDFWRETARSLGSTEKSPVREIQGGSNFMDSGMFGDPFATISGNGENEYAPVDGPGGGTNDIGSSDIYNSDSNRGDVDAHFNSSSDVTGDFLSFGNIDENNNTVAAKEEQRSVWADAREVTSGVEAVKQQLEEELTTYDAEGALENYRDAAREISNNTNNSDVVEEGVSFPGQAVNLSGSVYGGDAALDQEELEAWRESAGFEARDPKKETDFWRAAAREVITEVPQTQAPPPFPSTPENEADIDSDTNIESGPDDPLVAAVLPSRNTAPTFEPSQSRDATDAQPEATFADFHAADERWRSGIEAKTNTAANDWGGGLAGSESDSARWRAWDSANTPEAGSPKVQQGGPGGGGSLGEQTDMWMRAAREVTSDEGVEPPSSTSDTTTAKVEDAGGVDFWSSAAREITESLPQDGVNKSQQEQQQ